MYELLIKNGIIVTEQGCLDADLAVTNGKIAAISIRDTLHAQQEFDAAGCYVLPGGIDVHVHFDEPGFSDFEDFKCGSEAAASGGITAVADMPIDCMPANVSRKAFQMKKECAAASAVTCYFWAGLTESNLENMEELAEEGASGYKVFLSETGSDEFPMADDGTICEGLTYAARKGLPVIFHAENQRMIEFYRDQYRKNESCPDWRGWTKIRSIAGETEAIRRAGFWAQKTGAKIHIAHVSCQEGIREVRKLKAKGVNVTCETCGHYLYFSEEDYERKGALIKCAPALRTEKQKEALWQELIDGAIDMVSSDHSPCSYELLKENGILEAWAGISGIQFTMDVLYNEGILKRNMTWERLVTVFSANPARLLGIYGKKGVLAINSDADFFIFQPNGRRTVCESELYTRVKSSPYLEERFIGRVKATFVGGKLLYKEADGSESRFNYP